MLLYVHLRNEHSSQYFFCFEIYGIQNKNTQSIYANWNIKEKESHNYLYRVFCIQSNQRWETPSRAP